MSEKPILFSALMVQAILNTKPGKWSAEPIDPSRPYKSMTRRVVLEKLIEFYEVWRSDIDCISPAGSSIQSARDYYLEKAKYKPGNILWVREKHCIGKNGEIYYAANIPSGCSARNLATDCKWRPSIFMPREASRLTLKVKDVRVERVQDISENDALMDGLEPEWPKCVYKIINPEYRCPAVCLCDNAKEHFEKIWNHLNAKRGYSWDSNPWVYVIEFIRIT
jgi:hypothetical protein